jgi:hypothetical protein
MRLVEMGLLERQDEPKVDIDKDKDEKKNAAQTQLVEKIAKSDDEYESVLKSDLEERIKDGIVTEDEVKYFMNKGDAEKIAEEIKKTDEITPYQKKLLGWFKGIKEKSELGRPKAFYRRTDFGEEIYEDMLSKN